MRKSFYVFIGVSAAWAVFVNCYAITLLPTNQIGFAPLEGKLTFDITIFYGVYRLILYFVDRRNKSKSKTALNI